MLFCMHYRKKKKQEQNKHRMEQVVTNQKEEEVEDKKPYVDKRTPAQIAFDKTQEKRVSCPTLNWQGGRL